MEVEEFELDIRTMKEFRDIFSQTRLKKSEGKEKGYEEFQIED